jgi:hypothetical protein
MKRGNWNPPTIEDAKYLNDRCCGCLKEMTEEMNQPYDSYGNELGEIVSHGKVVYLTNSDCCKFGSISTLCMECLSKIYNQALGLGLVGGADRV